MEKSLQRYLRHHRAEGSSQHTIKFHEEGVGGCIKWLKTRGYSTDIADLDAVVAREWIAAMRESGLAQATVNRRVRSLRAFTRWLHEEEWLARNPLSRLRPPKVDDKAQPTLAGEEVERVLACCNRKTVTGCRDFALLLLLYSTGLRAIEALNIRTSDIDDEQGLILIRRGKGGKYRVVPLGDKVDRAIDKYMRHPAYRPHTEGWLWLTDEGDPLTYTGLRQLTKRLEQRSGIHCNPHKWRHSAAIQYLRSGGRVETLRAMLGHTTLEMTLHYARQAGIDLTTAHEAFDPARSLKVRV